MIDFSIGRGRAVGPRIELAPGSVAPEWSESINIDEEAFFLIESLMSSAPPIGDKFDRYGLGSFAAETWKDMLTPISRAIDDLPRLLDAESFNIDDFASLEWIAPHPGIRSELYSRGKGLCLQIYRMLKEFVLTTAVCPDRHRRVFYFEV